MRWFRWSVIILFLLTVLAVIATHLAIYQETDFFQHRFLWLLAADAILIFLLFSLISWRVVLLILSWRRGETGSRLSLRLTALFWLVSLLPVVLLYSVSVSAIFRGIESWFDVPLGQSFERGIEFGQDVVGREFNRLEFVARNIATNMQSHSGRLDFYIEDSRVLYQLDSIAFYDPQGRLRYSTGGDGNEVLSSVLKERIRATGLSLKLQGSHIDRTLEVGVPVAQGEVFSVLVISWALPEEIAVGLAEIERGRQEYEKVQILRQGLRWSFILILSLSSALILFMAGWLSLYLGRRLSAPLVQLSTTAEAVGRGDFTQRLPVQHSLGEIAQLNRSFNVMVTDLQQLHKEIAQRQNTLRQTNAYLENLLSSLTTGVLTFTAPEILSGYNNAAARFFAPDTDVLAGKTHLPDSPLSHAIHQAIADLLAAGEKESERRVVLADGSELLLRVVLLPESAGAGMLAMLDDISRQIRAERESTWEEASRRFVHEIKNPLTPIQLAAERLEDKLGGKLSHEDDLMLRRLVKMIVNQVDAMQQMVGAFRDYADQRRPLPTTQVQLNELLQEVLYFYESEKATIHFSLADDLPLVQGDLVTLRQLLHNVIRNALDALIEQEDARIEITTRSVGNWVELCIEDNGEGVSTEMLNKICEPYVTSKPLGTGLGLAVVRKTVDEHSGKLTIENSPRGLKVTVWLVKV